MYPQTTSNFNGHNGSCHHRRLLVGIRQFNGKWHRHIWRRVCGLAARNASTFAKLDSFIERLSRLGQSIQQAGRATVGSQLACNARPNQ